MEVPPGEAVLGGDDRGVRAEEGLRAESAPEWSRAPGEPTEQGVVLTYDRFAPLYDQVFGRVLGPGRKLMASATSALNPPSILEVGVGTGLTLAGYPASSRLVGIDLSPDMLERAMLIGATLTIDNHPEGGVEVKLSAPPQR